MHGEWEGADRHGVAWRRVLAAAGLAALVVVSRPALQGDHGLTVQTDGPPVVGATQQPHVVQQPPTRAGERWVCAPQRPVRAFASGRYYPPEHPTAPDFTARPQGCFVSSQWAESAGYELAPAPPDAVRVGSLYLVPAVAPTLAACADVATVVDFAVPCPRRLPAPGRGVSCTTSCVFYGRAAEPGVVIEQRGVALPTDWCDDCEGQVFVAATRDRSPAELVTCGPRMVVDARAGRDIAGYHDCGPAPPWLPGIAGYPHERHTLLVWEHGDLTYAVSMEGHSARIRAVLRGLRAGIELVTPPGR